MTKGKRKPPSRVKYEHSHPTVSCRVPKEVYDRLQEMKENEGKSFADILKTGLGILKLKAKKDQNAYYRGYKDGYRQAELKFKVTYRCNVCGESIVVNTRDEKEAVRQYMEEHRWGHRECHGEE
jgi:predicted CopG family antitoxin